VGRGTGYDDRVVSAGRTTEVRTLKRGLGKSRYPGLETGIADECFFDQLELDLRRLK
jgi:hypothetical protein